MALYSVSLNRTLLLSATVAVRAKNEEAAQARVEQMMSKGLSARLPGKSLLPIFSNGRRRKTRSKSMWCRRSHESQIFDRRRVPQ